MLRCCARKYVSWQNLVSFLVFPLLIPDLGMRLHCIISLSGINLDDSKYFSRDTVKGKKFVVWRLSDLSSQTAVVSLFLFGQAYQEHWKIPQGHVIALLNANIMPGREVGTYQAEGVGN